MSGWIDSHCHMSDSRIALLKTWVEECRSQGLKYFIQGGVGPEDWEKQIALTKTYPSQIGLCFGLHPYWVASHTQEECEEALDELSRKLSQAIAIGEIGLDFRPKFLGESQNLISQEQEKQISLFELQLELAETVKKPIVLHIVQAHEESLRILDVWGVPTAGGYVHSFNGSWERAKDFLDRGLLISVGGPLLRPNNEKLKQAVKSISLEKLLIETDCPDQPGPKYQGKLNPLISLFDVANEVGRIKGLSPEEILDNSRENLKRLFQLKENSNGTYAYT